MSGFVTLSCKRLELTMQVSPDTAAELRRILLGDAARLVVAIVSMAIGLGSILVQWMRRKTQDRVRLWFGLLAFMYGYRALLMTESARILSLRSHHRVPNCPRHLHDWHSRHPVWLGTGLAEAQLGDQVTAHRERADGGRVPAVLRQRAMWSASFSW